MYLDKLKTFLLKFGYFFLEFPLLLIKSGNHFQDLLRNVEANQCRKLSSVLFTQCQTVKDKKQ